MEYAFDVETASQYGVNEAVFIKNLQFWCLQNKANNRNQYEGRTWSYNSLEALQAIFPFWSIDQIRRLIKKLQKASVIVVRQFKKNQGDKRNWYAFVDQHKFLGFAKSPDAPPISQECDSNVHFERILDENHAAKSPHHTAISPDHAAKSPYDTYIYSDIKRRCNIYYVDSVRNGQKSTSPFVFSDLDKKESNDQKEIKCHSRTGQEMEKFPLAKLKETFRDIKKKLETKELTGLDIDKLPLTFQSAAILAFYSHKTGKAVLPVPSNLKPILGRLKEGLNENDLRCIIAMKNREWKDDQKMSKYIRISTLFRPSKFYDYLSALSPTPVLNKLNTETHWQCNECDSVVSYESKICRCKAMSKYPTQRHVLNCAMWACKSPPIYTSRSPDGKIGKFCQKHYEELVPQTPKTVMDKAIEENFERMKTNPTEADKKLLERIEKIRTAKRESPRD